MSLQDMLQSILTIPHPAAIVHDYHPLDVPTVYDLAVGDVFVAVDESDYLPQEQWYRVVEPVDPATGYGRFDIHYTDGYTATRNICAVWLDVTEVV